MAAYNQPRVVLTASQWQQIIESQQESDLNIKDFCAEQGLSRSSFFKWRRRLGLNGYGSGESNRLSNKRFQSNSEEEHNIFAEIELSSGVSESPAKAAEQSKCWDIELELGDGVCLRIRKAAS
jgi:transposase-like protein